MNSIRSFDPSSNMAAISKMVSQCYLVFSCNSIDPPHVHVDYLSLPPPHSGFIDLNLLDLKLMPLDPQTEDSELVVI